MASTDPEIIQPRDPNTLSNYTSWRTQHVTANLEIDFEGEKLVGSVVLKMKALRGRTDERVVLDSRYAINWNILNRTSRLTEVKQLS